MVASAASADNTPDTVASPERGASAARQKRRTWTRVCVPSPGYVVGPKTHRSARGASLVDSAGSQRVRVIVVESLGSRHRTNVSVGACPAARCKARRRERCLARRKPVPGREKLPDDQGRWREGEDGAHVSRGCQSRFSRGDATRGLRSSRGSRSRKGSNHGVRRLGLYAR